MGGFGGGGVSGSGTANRVPLFTAGSAIGNSVVTETAGVWSGLTAISFGATPSATGAVRLSNNTAILARNAANSADCNLISISGTDAVAVGHTAGTQSLTLNCSGTGSVFFAPGGTTKAQINLTGELILVANSNPASTGTIRLHNTASIMYRNAANSANLNLITTTAGDDITVAQNTAGVVLILDVPNQGLRINNQTTGAGAGAGTLANAPAAGDPAFWCPINIAGTVRYFPCW